MRGIKRVLIKNNLDADALEAALMHFGAWVEREGHPEAPAPGEPPRVVDGCLVVACAGDTGFLKFAMTNQGYAEVIRDLEGQD